MGDHKVKVTNNKSTNTFSSGFDFSVKIQFFSYLN